MNVKFMNSNEKKKFVTELNEKFGIDKMNYLVLETGKEKIRAFSGSLGKEDLYRLAEIARVEIIGLYFAKHDSMTGLRLSVDGATLLKDEIKKNVVQISQEQADEWMRGHNLDVAVDKGMHVVKLGKDILGCGFSNGVKLYNYLPRERQRRN